MSNNHTIKLLLHAEDGFIPFLSPYLLKTHFSPDVPLVKDHLIVGMALKDTCIVPHFESKQETTGNGNHGDFSLSNKQKKKMKRKMAELSSKEVGSNKRQRIESDNSDSNSVKPSGYKFDSQHHDQQFSSLISPGYNIMTVPTFDLVDDVSSFFLSNKKTKAKSNSYGKKKNANNSEKESNMNNKPDTLPVISANDNQVTFCTPHGMQKLSTESFIDITMKLKPKSTLGLYDQACLNDTNKRKNLSILRTNSFLSQLIEKNDESDKMAKKQIWSPVICSSTSLKDEDEEGSTINFKRVLEDNLVVRKGRITGITLVGWHHIQSRESQIQMLQQCSKRVELTSLKYGVLFTDNLNQILDISKYGGNMFGCNLPARWARGHKALGLSLKQEESGGNHTKDKLNLDSNGCIDMSNPIYSKDKSPLLSTCQCFSCTNGTYTKSYIHHLIEAKEMLADIVLFGHNLHQMLTLCAELSSSRENNKVREYCQFIEQQLA